MSSPLFDLTVDPKLAWYLTRASGLILLALLTVTVLLGIASTTGAAGGRMPRFVATDLHRRLSLLTVSFLALHVLSSIADNWVRIRLLDVVVPFQGAYRPIWLGLGTVALDLLLAVVVTSLLRHRLGLRAWRGIHYAVYLAWPVAVLHGLGTGTDASTPAVQALTLAGVGVVLLALASRLLATPGRLGAPRLAALVALPLAPLALAAWVLAGGTP